MWQLPLSQLDLRCSGRQGSLCFHTVNYFLCQHCFDFEPLGGSSQVLLLVAVTEFPAQMLWCVWIHVYDCAGVKCAGIVSLHNVTLNYRGKNDPAMRSPIDIEVCQTAFHRAYVL